MKRREFLGTVAAGMAVTGLPAFGREPKAAVALRQEIPRTQLRPGVALWTVTEANYDEAARKLGIRGEYSRQWCPMSDAYYFIEGKNARLTEAQKERLMKEKMRRDPDAWIVR